MRSLHSFDTALYLAAEVCNENCRALSDASHFFNFGQMLVERICGRQCIPRK